jgi:hypothetical protein
MASGLLNLKVDAGGNRLSRIVTNLRQSASPDVFLGLNLSAEARDLKKILLRYFPVSAPKTRSPGSLEQTRKAGEPGHLSQGWVADFLVRDRSLQLRLFHRSEMHEDIKNILLSLDKGGRASTWSPEGGFLSFLGADGRKWKVFKDVAHHATPALHYTERTLAAAVAELVPRVQSKVRQRLAKAVE